MNLPKNSFFHFCFGLLFLVGCPIPIPKTFLVRPEGEIKVVHQITQKPIAGAEIKVVRYIVGPPPKEQVNHWTQKTDINGKVHFTKKTETEWGMPLMPHGVPQYGWDIEVFHPKFIPIKKKWFIAVPPYGGGME
ncbi:MAG: hypothetical protein D6785_14370, partial [Planctomycetota bacterium]